MSFMKLLLHSKTKPEHESKSCVIFSVYFEEMITEACGHSGTSTRALVQSGGHTLW